MKAAVNAVENGMSVYAASKAFGIPNSTLYDHAKGKYKGYDTSFGPARALTDEEEEALVNYLKYMSECGFPLSVKMIRLFAEEILKSSGRPRDRDTGPTDSWVKCCFLKRHKDISLRTPHELDKSKAAVCQERLSYFYDLLQVQLHSIDSDPSRLFNVDETGFGGKYKSPTKVAAVKGARQAFKVDIKINGHITALMAISASGKVVPPYIVFSKNVPKTNFQQDLPGNWTFEATKSGFISTDHFVKWMKESFIPSIDNRRPVCLILDNHKSHLSTEVIECAQANGISLLYLPSNTSHILQPLDVGYFHVLKYNMHNLCSLLGYAGATCLPRHEFCKVFEQAVNKISTSNVISAFSEVGFLPFVKDKVKALSKPHQPTSGLIPRTDEDIECCPTCSQPTTNILVRTGLIPQSLAHILVPAPVLPAAKSAETCEARVIPAKTASKRKCFVPPPTVSKAAKPQETAATATINEPVTGPSRPTTSADDLRVC